MAEERAEEAEHDPDAAAAPFPSALTPAPQGIESVGDVIARRVREYRQQLNMTVVQLAERSGLSKSMLSKIENAQASPSLSTLVNLATAMSVPVTALFRGLDEEQDVLYVKAGQGLEIQHKGTRSGHRYQMLGSMRAPHDHMEPVLVTLTERAGVFPLFQHAGTELIYMLTGKMDYSYGQSRYTMEPGDTLQFHGEVTHGPVELHQLPVQFLSIKAFGPGPGIRD